ncbi:MAG: hypothetical protein KJ007_07900 [Burkholderiales bacterium]|nr:hypothetical protein [Burkholderiales bacterium]
MTKISSKWTLFHKWMFPVFWYGGLVYFVITSVAMVPAEADLMFLIVPAFMAVIGAFVLKKLVWILADEVYDCGDTLLVRKSGREERIALSNVINVSVSSMTNPPRITLRLEKPSRLGDEIVFSPLVPAISLNPFAKNAVGEDLIVRVDRARTKRAV